MLLLCRSVWFLALLLRFTANVMAQENKPVPVVLGNTYNIRSKVLGEDRTFNIYLPAGYTASDTTRYNVNYLLDGGTDEDFIHVAGLMQFASFEWVGWMQPTILVGISNVDRKRDFTFPSTDKNDRKLLPTSGGSARFQAYIRQEVIPWVEKRFRTTSSRTLIGESLGGLLATEMLFTQPGLFQRYIIISPSLWWDNGSLLQKKPQIDVGTFVYLAVGKEGLAPSSSPHVMEVDANVLKEKLEGVNGLHVQFDYLPTETHATISHQALLNAFRWIFR